MKIFNSIVLALVLSASGCALFNKEETPAEMAHKVKKETLEREIELLRLERRKILLQNSLDEIDTKEKPLKKS